MSRYQRRSGYSLAELLVVVVLVGLLLGLAAPSLRRQMARIRAHAALNRLAGDLYHARMLAVREGDRVDLVLRRDGGPCVRSYVIHLHSTGTAAREVAIGHGLPGLCLQYTGLASDSVIRFNSRGMILPPTRSLLVEGRGVSDSLKLSIAGRARRTF
jgi:prepilin-type N-terminal cleavage/methylation domain-containing protein